MLQHTQSGKYLSFKNTHNQAILMNDELKLCLVDVPEEPSVLKIVPVHQ